MVELYEGPLDEIARQSELDHADIKTYTDTQYPGESWNYVKPATLVKKENKIKSPKKEKVEEPEEPETREVRLIARVKSETEEELMPELIDKKRDSKSKLSGFGFFHRTSSTSHPETSEPYTGHLESTGKALELETAPFEHREIPAYSPKQIEVETPEIPAEPEKKRFHWFARWRHEGEEDIAEKPDAYTPSSKMVEVYEGPLDEIAPESELGYAIISDHSDKYHSGESWNWKKTPTPVATLEKKQKKAKSPKKEKIFEPEEPEVKEVRLIARVKSETEEDLMPEPIVKEKSPKKEGTSKFGFFSKTTKSPKATGYPETSDAYTGELDTTGRSAELEGTSFGHPEYPAYVPKKIEAAAPELPEVPAKEEQKEIRLIAYVKPEQKEKTAAEQVVKEKKPKKESSSKFGFFSRTTKTTKTIGYPKTSEAYTGELDTTDRSAELAASEFEHPEYPPYKPHVEDTTEIAGLPEVLTEKKKYRLIARFRHEGEEDVVEKPEAYGFATDVHVGPIDDIHRVVDLDQVPLGDYLERTGESWKVEELTTPIATLEKKQKKIKSPKKEMTPEPLEPEKKEVRLIARVRTEPEEPVAEPVVKEKKPKKESSSKFGFFSKTTKTTKTTGYPETSEAFTGDIDTTDRTKELEGTSFEHGEIPAYSPKKIEVEVQEVPKVPAEPEKKRYRLIARWRHDGEEDVADKPDAYTPSSTMLELYEGPLEEIAPQSELDHADIKDYTDTQYPGESWNWKKTPTPVATLEKKKKRIRSPKKEKVAEPEEPEKKEIRLIARIKSEPEEEPVVESVKEKKPKKESSSKFGFFSKTIKTTKTTGYPESSDAFTGEIDTTNRSAELEGISFEHSEYPAYAPKTVEAEAPEIPEVPAEPEKKRYRLIARWRHEGEEDVIDKPDAYTPSSNMLELYEGPLDEIERQSELDQADIKEYTKTQYPGESWNWKKTPTPVATLEKKEKKAKSSKKEKSPEPEKPEVKEVRLIARVKSEPEEEPVERVKEKKPKKESSSKFGFFSKTTKTTRTIGYPESSDAYTGELDTTNRSAELEGTSFEHPDYPEYAPKKIEVVAPDARDVPAETEKKQYRLFVRVRHEGEEDVADKPEAYTPSSNMAELYEGPLDETSRQAELDHSDIKDYTETQYPGESWNWKKTPTPVATLEKKEKKIKSPKKEKTPEPVEPEKKEIRLIARIKSEPEEEPIAEPVVKEKKPKKESSSKFGFFSKTTKTTKTIGYPKSSEAYTGELDTTDRSRELEGTSFEHPEYPAYAPKKIEVETPIAPPTEDISSEVPEKKEIRLIAYVKSEPEEGLVQTVIKEKKPKKEGSSRFGFFSRTTKTVKRTGYPESSDAYTGELDTTNRSAELEGTSFEHPEYPAYAPKKIEVAAPEVPEISIAPERKRYRLIARWRHEGDEDVADKPEAYTPSSKMVELYEGPLDEIARQSELDHSDIKGYTDTQYPGESWNYKRPSTLEKKEKKIKSPKKEKDEEPEEPETKEIRLIARVKSEPEDEEPAEPIKEKKPSKFGFFHRSSKASSPTSESPEPAFEGPLDTTIRSDEFETIPFEHSEFTASTPIKTEQVIIEVPEEKKHSRFNWFSRWRHEGDEDVVEKPSAYAFSSDVYDGPLEDLYRQGDVDQALITEYSEVYAYKPYQPKKPVREKVKTPEPEPIDVKLVARIPPMEPEERTSPVKDRPRTSSFNIFHRHSKQHHGYPEQTDVFTGDLDVTGRSQDVEKSPFEMRTDYPEYSPKKVEPELPAEPPQQSRLHRLFARWRHEGEEDVVEKPGLYKFSSDVYEGPLEEIRPEGEVEQAPIQEHSEIYEYVEYRDGSKKPKSPKSSKKVVEKETTPESSETHEVKLLTRVKSEEPEEPEVQETTPSKPFRLRFLSLAKKTQESEYPETSPVYEGPLDLTSRSDEMEPMPYLHGATPRYSPKVTPVKRKTPEPSVEKKKIRLIARLRHEGDEDTVEKPEDYGHSTEVYSGELEETHKKQEIVQVPLGEYSDIKKKVADKNIVRLVARVPPQQETEHKKPASKFRLFPLSKSSSSNKGYPATSPTYEGPMDITGRVKSLDHVPLETREIPPYSPRKSTVSVEKELEEPKRYRLIARFKHEGDEDVVEKPEGYTPSSNMLEPYEGPFDEISRSAEVEETSLRGTVDVKYDVETFKVEKRQKKKKSDDVSDSDEQEPEPKARFSFLRTQKPRSQVTSYPSSSYSGPLETTDLNMDLENIPLTIPVHEPIIERVPRKYRLIHRHRHAGEEDELTPEQLHPAYYSFPVNRYTGKVSMHFRERELPEVPIHRFVKVYHSGSSNTLIWNLLNARSSRASRDLEDVRRVEPKKEVKLIARVLPMQKTPEKEEKTEKLSKEEQEVVETLTRTAELMDTSRTLTRNLSAINYIPSSLQYNPRPARIEGTTEEGDCYVEVRHERRAEVQLEPAYVLRETSARSHAYLSTATAVFSGVSPQAASSSSAGAQASTSHSLVLPSFVGSVSEDETGLHHFSWTPQHMSPQPERMSLLARLGFKRDKSKKKENKKKSSNGKKGENETSGETSDSEHDEKREFAVVEFDQHASPTITQQQNPSPPKKPEHRTQKSPGRRLDEPMNEVTVVVTSSERPKELKNTKEVRHETREQQFRLTGDGYTSGFNPNDPSLMATIQRAERLNASSPRLEHAERTFTVRANAPLPVSFEESGQPYTTVSTWQETSDLPEQVEVYTDENGRQITRTVKSSQVKHTVQTQSFQNYIVDGDQVPVGVVDVERSREQLTPLGQKASSSSSSNGAAENGGDSSGIVETQTRTMTYEAQGGENAAPPGWAEQGLGEYVSSKSVTQGNRTIETITYKTEKDGVVETHVEHRVTIHSDGDIDHDAELSQAILEATQMNPDMVVEKIEVRQETTQ